MMTYWGISTSSLVTVLLAGCVFAGSAGAAEDGWIALFNSQNLDGWQAAENPGSFQVVDGAILCNGPRAHLFYAGEVQNAQFENFEFQADVMTRPGANSGIYFHTRFQDRDFPAQGYEVQINNTATGEGGYVEFKRTGSLYAVRNVYKSLIPDNEWFTLRITVAGKWVRIHLNGMLVVDYVEPDNPPREGEYAGRRLSRGTFALQCHDPGSKVFFKNIRVKPLPEGSPGDAPQPPAVDETYRRIAQLHAANFPLVDFHVHLKGGLTLEQALALSRRDGINYGVVINCGVGFSVNNDEGVTQFLDSMKGQPVYAGLQGEGREWVNLVSPETRKKFDYVFTDAMTFTDGRGKRVRLWIPEEVHIDDKQQFMDMYVDRIQYVLNNEPIDIYVNPTFLPDVIAAEYDSLWTPERMQAVIGAAAQNHVAIEINNRYRLPSPAFIKLAKKAGVKFTFGTNNGDANLGRLEYCLDMIRECGLTETDMFLPKKK
ncbi:MAG: family 16 glycoside hydrolase [bacterium]